MEGLEQIIRGCIRNDRASQEKLYKQFYVPLFCLCRKYFKHDHEAIESVNDGMLKVFSSIHAFREDKGKFFNWVYTIVRNVALDKFRSQRSNLFSNEQVNGIENMHDRANGHNPLIALEGKDLFRLLDQLSPATRVVCNLYYLEGYRIRDIARQLNVSEGTVKWQLSEGRRKLRIVFEKILKERP
ncbi:MAG: RNA polymerase sigma factor [Chitinophagales bacterium]